MNYYMNVSLLYTLYVYIWPSEIFCFLLFKQVLAAELIRNGYPKDIDGDLPMAQVSIEIHTSLLQFTNIRPWLLVF